jgi:hypothetical protein
MTDDQFNQMMRRFDRLEEYLTDKAKTPGEIYLDNADIMRLLKISKGTLCHWRRRGILPYTKLGHKFYYLLSDVEELVEEHQKQRAKNPSLAAARISKTEWEVFKHLVKAAHNKL